MRSIYTCLVVLFGLMPVQLLKAGVFTDTTRQTAHFNVEDKYVHVWQGDIDDKELETALRVINTELSKNKIPGLHLVIGAVGVRGRHTLLDATSANPEKALIKKQLTSQNTSIKKRTDEFNQWIRTQVDGDKILLVRLNVIAEQTWTDGMLTSKFVFEPFFSCPVRDGKAIIAEERVSLITKELERFSHGANITDQKSFDAEVSKLLQRIQNGLIGKLQPQTAFALSNSMPYDIDKAWAKNAIKRIETGKPKEDIALAPGGSRIYDLSDILTNTEKTSINLLLDYINGKLKNGLDLGNLGGNLGDGLKQRLEEMDVLITDFRMPIEQLQEIENWMAKNAAKAVVWLHFDKDMLMYEFRAGANRLFKNVCLHEKAAVYIANVKVNQLVYDITSLYAATVNYFVPGKVTPLPRDYVAKYPFFQSISITVPGIPATWYNPDEEGYYGMFADYLFNNDWQKMQRIAINALEEWLTDVKWPADADLTKYSVDRQHFALVCGFLNVLPDLLNGALNLPKGAISTNELLCDPAQMEKLVAVLGGLSQQAKALGGYYGLARQLVDNVHINPCMAAYYTGNMCAMLLTSYVAIARVGKISNVAAFIAELGNLEPVGIAMNVLLSPAGKFVKFAVAKSIGLWNLGRYAGKYVYLNGRYVLRLAMIEGKDLLKDLSSLEWRSVEEILKPMDWIEAEGPNGEKLQIAYFNQNNGNGNGGNGKKPKVTDLSPGQSPKEGAADATTPTVKDRIGLVKDPVTGEDVPVIIKARESKKVNIAESDRVKLVTKEQYVKVPLYDEDGQLTGYLARHYYDGEINYFFRSKDVKPEYASASSNARAQYLHPSTANALPNRGEGYVLISFTFNGQELREGINSLEHEIVDNILRSFAGKKADNLFLQWPERNTEFQKAQQELVTKVLMEKYGYHKPELRTDHGLEYVVFTRPPAPPSPVKRYDYANLGSPGTTEFFLSDAKSELVLRISRTTVRNTRTLTFSYTDLRIEDKVLNQTNLTRRFITNIYSARQEDLARFGIDKVIDNVMTIDIDAMPPKLEVELPGTMREVRNEALAYFNKNHHPIDVVKLDLDVNYVGDKSFDMITYEAVYEQTKSIEKAISAMPTAQWARKNGFTKAIVLARDPDVHRLNVLFAKNEIEGLQNFNIDEVIVKVNSSHKDIKEFVSEAPVGSTGKKVHLLLADGSGEIIRRSVSGKGKTSVYKFKAKETGKPVSPDEDIEEIVASAYIETLDDLKNKGGLKQLSISFSGSDEMEKLRVPVLQEALAYYKPENVRAVQITLDDWTDEITDLEILRSDIGKLLSKEFPEITIQKNESIVTFSKESLKQRTEIVVPDIPNSESSARLILTIKSKAREVEVGLLYADYTEAMAFTFSFDDFFSSTSFKNIANASIGINSEGKQFLVFRFNIDPAIGNYVLEPHLFDKSLKSFAERGMVFNEISISWKNGFADAHDTKAFREALKYGPNSAIFQTEVGKRALEWGYTKAVVEVADGRVVGVRFLKTTQPN